MKASRPDLLCPRTVLRHRRPPTSANLASKRRVEYTSIMEYPNDALPERLSRADVDPAYTATPI
eukprot:1949132-Pleurochrysis_carterae.AAC.1